MASRLGGAGSHRARCLLGGASMLFAAVTCAATLPPSLESGAQQNNSLQQQRRLQQSRKQPALRGPVLVGPRPPGAASVAPGGPRFTLHKVEFSPSHFLSRATLRQLAAPYLGRPITVADLYRLVDTVNALYDRRELLTARAVLPPQKIRHGTVRIRLVEGRVGQVLIQGHPYTRPSFILSRLPLRQGQVVDAPQLEQALEYFNRTNSLGLRAALRPGTSFGLSNVLLYAVEPPRYGLDLLLNNQGDDATGRNQIGLYGTVNGPLRLGDQANVYVTKSSGALNGNLSYQVPLDARGLSANVSVAYNHIHIVSGPYQALDITGHSQTLQAGLTQPLLADDAWLLTAGLAYARISSQTSIAGSPLNDTTVKGPQLGFTAVYGRARRQAQLTQTLMFSRSDNALGQSLSYRLWQGSLNASQGFGKAWAVSADAGWQFSSEQALPAAQLYQLGGTGTIPGYPLGVVSGYKGYFAGLALHRSLPWLHIDSRVFYDYGVVYASFPPRTTLASIGVGLDGALPRWGWLKPASWGVTLAHPLQSVTPTQSSLRIELHLVVPLV